MKFFMKFFILIIVIICVVVSEKKPKKPKKDKKDICYLKLDDINIREFFSDVIINHAKKRTKPYQIVSMDDTDFNNGGYTFNQKITECDIFNNETIIKIIYGQDSYKISEFLKLYNLKEMEYFTQFLDLKHNLEDTGKIRLKDFYKFYLGTMFSPDKYKDGSKYLPPSLDIVDEDNVNINDVTQVNPTQIDWSSVGGSILGGSREYDIDKEMSIIRDESLKSLNIFVILSKNAYNLRREINNMNPVELNVHERRYTIFDHWSKSISEYFGIYERDEQGRKAYSYVYDFAFPLFHQLINNNTFVKHVTKSIMGSVRSLSFKQVRLLSLMNYVYTNIQDDLRWTNMKNTFYGLFFGKKIRYTLTVMNNIFRNPVIRSLSLKDLFGDNTKIRKIRNYFLQLNYIYGSHSLEKTNVIRFSNSFNYLRPQVYNIFNNQFHETTTNETFESYETFETYETKIKKKRRGQGFFDRPYYDGIDLLKNNFNENKYYNLPDYNTTNGVEWILSPFDLFDTRFWSYRYSWFTGFHPNDRRKIRTLTLVQFGLPIPIFIPSDFFSMFRWGLHWLLRSNITTSFLPFLHEHYPANEMLCLPRPIVIPDPRYGCAPPHLEPIPPIFPPENYTDLFKFNEYGLLTFCLPYRIPTTNVLLTIQSILTSFLAPFLDDIPELVWVNDWIHSTFGFRFILDDSSLLPVGFWQCLLPQLPVYIVVGIIGFIIGFVTLISCVKNLRLAFVVSGGVINKEEIRDIKHQMDFITEEEIGEMKHQLNFIIESVGLKSLVKGKKKK